MCEAHNSTVGGDRERTVNEGLATARKQDIAERVTTDDGRRRLASRDWRQA
jgi:hypothetical protein